jgi:hypothetical protein
MDIPWPGLAVGVLVCVWLIVRLTIGRMGEKRSFGGDGPFRQAMRKVKEKRGEETDDDSK